MIIPLGLNLLVSFSLAKVYQLFKLPMHQAKDSIQVNYGVNILIHQQCFNQLLLMKLLL